MSGRLRQALEQVARRFRSVRMWGGLAACWLVLALAGWAVAALGPLPGMADIPAAWVPALLALLAAMLGMGCAWPPCGRRAIPDGWPGRSRPATPS